jgi:hypothetical protein
MVIVPTVLFPLLMNNDVERDAVAEFGAAAKFTVPIPIPDCGDVTFTQPSSARTCHGQPVCVVIVKTRLLPAAGTAMVSSLKVKVQAGGGGGPVPMGDWVTVKTCPAMVSVPTRWAVVGLAATE